MRAESSAEGSGELPASQSRIPEQNSRSRRDTARPFPRGFGKLGFAPAGKFFPHAGGSAVLCIISLVPLVKSMKIPFWIEFEMNFSTFSSLHMVRSGGFWGKHKTWGSADVFPSPNSRIKIIPLKLPLLNTGAASIGLELHEGKNSSGFSCRDVSSPAFSLED